MGHHGAAAAPCAPPLHVHAWNCHVAHTAAYLHTARDSASTRPHLLCTQRPALEFCHVTSHLPQSALNLKEQSHTSAAAKTGARPHRWDPRPVAQRRCDRGNATGTEHKRGQVPAYSGVHSRLLQAQNTCHAAQLRSHRAVLHPPHPAHFAGLRQPSSLPLLVRPSTSHAAHMDESRPTDTEQSTPNSLRCTIPPRLRADRRGERQSARPHMLHLVGGQRWPTRARRSTSRAARTR